MHRYPIDDRELPEWIQRQNDDADPLPLPWSPARLLALGAAAAGLALLLLVFGAVGVVAAFGVKP